MPKLGISIYPEVSKNIEQDMAYIDLAASYGFKRIFTCLLSAEGKSKEEIKEEFETINRHAADKGFEIVFDVAPCVFQQLGVTSDDLSFFKALSADGIRLDEGFNGQKEAMMTMNPERLKIEVNASQDTGYIDLILSYKPYKDHLITCHNFYPQRYSGLSFEQFYKTSKAIKEKGLKVAAFIGSQAKDTFGPWPIHEGLCSLEMHRNLPLDLQARHLYATQLVDDILIANAYASEAELKTLSEIHPGKVTLKVDVCATLSEVEKEILFQYPHFVRGDMSEYTARSTMSRITYADASIPATNTPTLLHRGDVVILNDEYGRYKGELQVILKEMPNEGKMNLVAQLKEKEEILLPYLTPWQAFQIIE